jgi:hypothetical protein
VLYELITEETGEVHVTRRRHARPGTGARAGAGEPS